jgi:hypothetical protein
MLPSQKFLACPHAFLMNSRWLYLFGWMGKVHRPEHSVQAILLDNPLTSISQDGTIKEALTLAAGSLSAPQILK